MAFQVIHLTLLLSRGCLPSMAGPTGLTAYYTFEPTAPLLDLASSLGDLQASGSPSYAPDAPWPGSHGAVLESSSDSSGGGHYFRLGAINLGALSAGAGFSICTWFALDAVANWARIFDLGLLPFSPTRNNVALSRRGVSTELVIYYGCGSTTFSFPDPIVNGEWRHVCAVNQGRNWSFYDNGEISMSLTAACSLNSVLLTSNFIGRSNYNNDRLMIGRVDEFRIYRRALLPSEVATIHSGACASIVLSIALLASRQKDKVGINRKREGGRR